MSKLNREKRRHQRSEGTPQGKSKICLCCIVKDDSESHLFERMLASFMPYMDGLAVAITGLSGKHERICHLTESYKGRYVVATPETHPQLYCKDENDNFFFAHFGQARNLSFQLAERVGCFDWLCVADADDVLMAGHELQMRADQALKQGHMAVMFPYWYSIHVQPDGTFSRKDVAVEHMYERILRPGEFTWMNRVHEVVVPVYARKPQAEEWRGTRGLSYGYSPLRGNNCVWVHEPDNSGSQPSKNERNIRLLKLQRQEEKARGQLNPRTSYLLGVEHLLDAEFSEDFQRQAEYFLHEFLQNCGNYSGPDAPSEWEAWAFIAGLRDMQGDASGALAAAEEAEKAHRFGHLPMG